MATVPDGQPAGTDVVGIAVSAPVASVMYTPGPIVVGLGGGPVTGPCPPPPAGEAPGAGEAQDATATDSSTHAAASHILVSLNGHTDDHRFTAA
jgi:hypothetical protein